MSSPYDITFMQDALDRADPPARWRGYIPFDGEPCPGSDATGLDAEALPFAEWAGIYAQEPWMLEAEPSYFVDYIEEES